MSYPTVEMQRSPIAKNWPVFLIVGVVMFMFALLIANGIIQSRLNARTQIEKDAKKAASPFSDRAALEKAILAKIGKLPAKWQSVDLEIKDNDVSATIWYAQPQTSRSIVEADTKTVGRAVLAVLTDQNYDPSKESLALFIYGQRRRSGETGKALVQVYGNSMYEWDIDQFKFREGI